ncbi:MAG: hypothetical protein COB66_05465 [Coxiella sp. (in: Bacteria)]|nr:MAG: hypothetical protein COB66_05465 [Coxiella sp. (in: g-proteobacteria)]
MNLIDNHIVSVRILGKNYNIKCPPEQADALKASAQLLENKLCDMKQANGSTSTDRMLVVTALNSLHELSALKNEKSSYTSSVDDKLQNLQSRIQSFLSADEELVVA